MKKAFSTLKEARKEAKTWRAEGFIARIYRRRIVLPGTDSPYSLKGEMFEFFVEIVPPSV